MHLLPNITNNLHPGDKPMNYFSLRHFLTAFFKITATLDSQTPTSSFGIEAVASS